MDLGLQPGIFKIMQALYLKFNHFNTCLDLALLTCFHLVSSLGFTKEPSLNRRELNSSLLHPNYADAHTQHNKKFD